MSRTDEQRKEALKHRLTSLLNSECIENGSDTPDFILANYLLDCLRAWELATRQREHWYGRKIGAWRESAEADKEAGGG